MKIKTKDLQDKVAILSTVIGNNVALPITCLVGMKTEGNKLKLIVKGVNSAQALVDVENVIPNMNLSIRADIFLKLIPKISCDELEMLLDNENIVIKTSYADYRFPKTVSTDGDVTFEDIVLSGNSIGTFAGEDISLANSKSTYALSAQSGTGRDLENYHFYKDKIVTSNASLVAKIVKTFNLSTDLSLSQITIKTLMTAFSKISGDAEIFMDGDNMFISMNDFILQTQNGDILSFPISAIEQFFTQTYANSINVNKQELLDALDRLSVFTSSMIGVNSVHLNFKADKLSISAGKDVEENISYRGKMPTTPFECNMDLNYLKSTIANTSDSELIDMDCNLDKCLKISTSGSSIYSIVSYAS